MDLDIIHVQHPLSSIYTAEAEPCELALGFFDGVHLGHQELINLAKRIAKQQDLKLAVMTFFHIQSKSLKTIKSLKHTLLL